MSNYSSSFRTDSAARDYDEKVYRADGHDAFIDALQRERLPPLVYAYFGGKPPAHLDFACGSGRAIEMFAGVTAEAHGYDVSPEMLARGQRRCPEARFHQLGQDGKSSDVAAGDRLLTAFRFVLNASPEERASFARWAAEAARGSGRVLLLLDNHGNSRSLRSLAGIYRRRRGSWFNTMSSGEVGRLLSQHGFIVLSRHGFGVLPRSAHGISILRPLARRIDTWASRHAWTCGVSIDVVYLAVPATSA